MAKPAGYIATEQDIDEQIARVSKLPCTGEGVRTPLFAESQESIGLTGLDVRSLDSGEKFPGHPCPHCTYLAVFKYIKSLHEAKRLGLPEPPTP